MASIQPAGIISPPFFLKGRVKVSKKFKLVVFLISGDEMDYENVVHDSIEDASKRLNEIGREWEDKAFEMSGGVLPMTLDIVEVEKND